MAYASWSVVFGEQPSAAKWNILGTNDASFNDGTGIAGLYKDLLAVDSNPYKFSATANSGTTGAGSFAKITTFTTEVFDTNSNFASSTYTAPVTGFYLFECSIVAGPGATDRELSIELYKNGASIRRLAETHSSSTLGLSAGGASLESATAGDTFDIYAYGTAAMNLSADHKYNRFQGFLVCRT